MTITATVISPAKVAPWSFGGLDDEAALNEPMVLVCDVATPFKVAEEAVMLVVKVVDVESDEEVTLASLVLIAAASTCDEVSARVEDPDVLPVNDERAWTLMQDADAQESQLCTVIWQVSSNVQAGQVAVLLGQITQRLRRSMWEESGSIVLFERSVAPQPNALPTSLFSIQIEYYRSLNKRECLFRYRSQSGNKNNHHSSKRRRRDISG